MKDQDISKYSEFVKKLCKKRGDINHIVSAEDLEQELWMKLLRNWNKPNKTTGISLATAADSLTKKIITIVFKNMTKDIVSKYVRRYDTYMCAKFSHIEATDSNVSDKDSATNFLGRVSSETIEDLGDNLGNFNHSPENPEDIVKRNELLADILDWAEDLKPKDREVIKNAIMMSEEVEAECQSIYGQAGKKKYPTYVISKAMKINPNKYNRLMKELQDFVAFREKVANG